MDRAPLHAELAGAPDGGEAWWLTASSGVRIRAAAWPRATGTPARGTVLIFPGRTEYIEKYGAEAADFTAQGYAVVIIDWRGQGLSDRLIGDPMLGHVDHFNAYQHDLAAAMNLAAWLELPEPHFLLAHSMGGCIGLRALHEGLAVRAAAFSAPMWGIQAPAWQVPLNAIMALTGPAVGLGPRRVPFTERLCYAADAPFEDNRLTSDPEKFAFLQGQLLARPELQISGPTLAWGRAALFETERLARMAPPDLPAVAFLGSDEGIVSPARIRAKLSRWAQGNLHEIAGARHEILMETPATRAFVLERTLALFDAAA